MGSAFIRSPHGGMWHLAGVLIVIALLALGSGLEPKAGISAESCNVSGSISTDTTWSPSTCDPYIATASVLVPSGVTLTIAPGTTVKFDSLKGLMVQGTLVARGSPDNLVTFTTNKASPADGDWVSIHFTDSSSDAAFNGSGDYVSGSIVQHALIEYAGSSGWGGALTIESSSPYIDHNIIRNNRRSGISASNSASRITYNTIIDNEAGIAGGIAVGGSAVVSSNNITGNTAIYDGGGGMWLTTGTVTVISNTITGNTAPWGGGRGGGILMWYGNHIISNNDVYSNTMGTLATPNDLYLNESQAGGANIDAKNNYWGTTDPTVIGDHIWDFFDDSNKAIVDYVPFLSSPVNQPPVSTPTATPLATPTTTATPPDTPSPTPTSTPDKVYLPVLSRASSGW